MNENELKRTTHTVASQIIFVIIIIYAVSSINVFLLALGILPFLPAAYLNPYLLLTFSIASFAFTLLMAAYHLSTMIRRRKRKTDRVENGTAG
ncbi:MAG: hypothetical protein LBG84_11545 [Treponema sp.]|nr:hypothetical protein [Treponema sp.]